MINNPCPVRGVFPTPHSPFTQLKRVCPGFPTWAPRRGHGDKHHIIDHALCVVHLAASPYDGISSTAMMVCCPLSGGTRVDQHRGHAESVIGKDEHEI